MLRLEDLWWMEAGIYSLALCTSPLFFFKVGAQKLPKSPMPASNRAPALETGTAVQRPLGYGVGLRSVEGTKLPQCVRI